jgi:hypothetical protein
VPDEAIRDLPHCVVLTPGDGVPEGTELGGGVNLPLDDVVELERGREDGAEGQLFAVTSGERVGDGGEAARAVFNPEIIAK